MNVLQRLLFLLFINLSTASANEPAGVEWLEKMSQAMKVLNYRGTVAFMKNGHLDTMKYSHATQDGKEQERLLSLNSPLREVIRDSGKVSCTFKETQKRVVNHRPVSQSFIIDLPKQIESLSALYSVEVVGEESVAMRPAKIINVQPRDAYRYSRKIWLDTEWLLPLKVEIYNEDGDVLEQVVFTDINVEQQIPFAKAEEFESGQNIKHIHQAESESFEQASFEMDNLPVGFAKVFFTRMSMHKSSRSVDHLLLSDGFSSISIYLDDKNEEIESGLHALGSVNSYTRLFGDIQVTVLGEVPAQTVEFIARGIRVNN